MKLHIVSATKSQNYNVNWLEINTEQGNFVIQNGHAPMIVELKNDSTISFNVELGNTMNLKIKNGIAEIGRSHTMILITHE